MKNTAFLCGVFRLHLFWRHRLVHLSDQNYKKYQAILRFKHQILEADKILTSKSTQNKDIDEFGEIVTKSITHVQKHLTSEEIDSMAVQYQSGKTLLVLAKEYGCHRDTVSKALKNTGYKFEEGARDHLDREDYKGQRPAYWG